ncbi:GNAT family N-acetyltransferase [Vibrio parahaemolyticus]|uniref:GNAT family N-acetyltransferase n=1 Tax=Vibrio parahaemolyticus TaxID=670 RepID=UPI001F4E6C80|nr:GNAT family N-acetyltransferase [Vibrio parahaemolyticus]
MKLEFEVVDKIDLQDHHRQLFADMLRLQGKVQGNLLTKADRCKSICIASIDGKPVAIGAIKTKTCSDFTDIKADLPQLEKEFSWELGYLFTDPKFQGQKIARNIVQVLIHHFGSDNLMASTEITANPGMVKILESNGFKLFGKPWKSSIHEHFLGLFLKFK